MLSIAEVMTLTFVLGMMAGGAAAAAVVAAAGGPAWAQVLTFILGAGVLLGLVMPVARRHRNSPAKIRTGTAKLIGARAMALSDINTAERRAGPDRRGDLDRPAVRRGATHPGRRMGRHPRHRRSHRGGAPNDDAARSLRCRTPPPNPAATCL